MNIDKAIQFVWENGRLLERRILEYACFNGSKEHVLQAIKAYQNEDGGFGHALEPDVRASESQPLFIEFGLRTLYENKIYDQELAEKVCGFVSQYAHLQEGIPTLLTSAQHYPKAPHWQHSYSYESSFSRLTGLVGLLNFHQVNNNWLKQAVDACLNDISTAQYDDAHTILTAFCLLESLPQTEQIRVLYKKLEDELFKANYFILEAPPQSYGLTPLDFAPTADSYCRNMFSDESIQAHLNALKAQQQEDGGWPISWEPPSELAKLEWRAYKTLHSILTLRSYGVIEI